MSVCMNLYNNANITYVHQRTSIIKWYAEKNEKIVGELRPPKHPPANSSTDLWTSNTATALMLPCAYVRFELSIFLPRPMCLRALCTNRLRSVAHIYNRRSASRPNVVRHSTEEIRCVVRNRITLAVDNFCRAEHVLEFFFSTLYGLLTQYTSLCWLSCIW